MSEMMLNKAWRHEIAVNETSGIVHYVSRTNGNRTLCGLTTGECVWNNFDVMSRSMVFTVNVCKRCKTIFEGSKKIKPSDEVTKVFEIDKCLSCTHCLNQRVYNSRIYFCVIKSHRTIPNPNELVSWCPRRGWAVKWLE